MARTCERCPFVMYCVLVAVSARCEAKRVELTQIVGVKSIHLHISRILTPYSGVLYSAAQTSVHHLSGLFLFLFVTVSIMAASETPGDLQKVINHC